MIILEMILLMAILLMLPTNPALVLARKKEGMRPSWNWEGIVGRGRVECLQSNNHDAPAAVDGERTGRTLRHSTLVSSPGVKSWSHSARGHALMTMGVVPPCLPSLCCRLRGGAGADGRARRSSVGSSTAAVSESLLGSGRRGWGKKGSEGENAMAFLPAEMQVQGDENIDQWGRHLLPPPSSSTGDAPHREGYAEAGQASNDDGLGGGGEQSSRGRRQRQMITFDLAEMFPQCRGLGLNFTSPLKPTTAELDASVAVAHRQMMEHIMAMPVHERLLLAREACSQGLADKLIEEGEILAYVKFVLDPRLDSIESRFHAVVPSSAGGVGNRRSSRGTSTETGQSKTKNPTCSTNSMFDPSEFSEYSTAAQARLFKFQPTNFSQALNDMLIHHTLPPSPSIPPTPPFAEGPYLRAPDRGLPICVAFEQGMAEGRGVQVRDTSQIIREHNFSFGNISSHWEIQVFVALCN